MNKKSKDLTFGLIMLLLVLAIVGLFVQIGNQTYQFLSTPLFVVMASSIIAWMQLKRFQELTEAYSITANELGMIKSKAKHIDSDDDLSKFVDDAENAISREHTLWLARRDNINLFR